MTTETITTLNLTTGQKEQFELIDLQAFSPDKYTERQIAILTKNLDGIATLRQRRTLYTAYVKKDGTIGGASRKAN